jgi:hypothetical protein
MESTVEDVIYRFGGLVWPVHIIDRQGEPEDVTVGHPECPDHGPHHIQRSLGSTIMLLCTECGKGGPFMGDDMDQVSADVGRWALAELRYGDEGV